MKVGEDIFSEAANAFWTDILLKQSIGYSCILCKKHYTALHHNTPHHAILNYYYVFYTGTMDSFNLCFYLQFNWIISDIENTVIQQVISYSSSYVELPLAWVCTWDDLSRQRILAERLFAGKGR